MSKTGRFNAGARRAGIIAALLLAGMGCRKAAPPPPAIAPAVADDSILLKEDFATLDSGKWPKEWRGWEGGKMKIKEEGGTHFLEFTAANAFRMRLSRIIPCSPKYGAYAFSVGVRVQDMTPQRGEIRGATLGVDWLDADRKDIGESDLDYLTASGNWKLLQGVYQAHPGAAAMRVFPLLNRCGGTVDFENIMVKGVEMEQEKVAYEENFENIGAPAQIKSWQWYGGKPEEFLAIKSEDGARFLEFHGSNETELRRFGSVEIPLDPNWNRIRFSVQARGRGLQTDSTQAVAGLCVLGYWKDEFHHKVSSYRVQTDTMRNNDVWKHLDVERQIPPRGRILELNLMFLFASGGVDISDLKVTVVQ